MIAKLLRFALQQRFVMIAMSLGLIALGIYSFRQLKVEAYPDISDTQAVVITLYPGHAAEEVEQQVTVPIERALNGVPSVIARRSRTIFGLSVVELTFAYGTDDYFARAVVLEKLRDATLPDNVTPTLGPLATPIGELYRYVVEGKGYSDIELRDLEDWVIEPRFRQVPGIADVTPFGGLVKQYQVEIDPQAIDKYNLSIGQIAQAVGANNQNAGGALLDNNQQSMVIRGVGLIQNTDDVENIVVAENKGVPVFVRDIGKVKIGAAQPTGIFGIGDQTGVEGIVLMRRGENPTDVLKGVHEAVEDINSTRLPPGVHIRGIYDRTDLVANTMHTVSHTLLEGIVVMVTMLLLFLGSVRAALLTAITIPLALLFAFVCMYFTGIPANLLSLGALDFGIIVDGTLVMVEHIVHHLQEREHTKSRATVFETILNAALEVESPIFFSLLDHYLRLYSAVHAGTRGAATVHADGVHGVFRAARLHAAGADADSGAGDIPFPQRMQDVGQPCAAVAVQRLRARAAGHDPARLADGGLRRGSGGRGVRTGRFAGQRVSAAIRRRNNLGTSEFSGWDLAQ